MATLRMDHVSVVVDDLAAATAFFVELGLEVEGDGEQRVEGEWVDRINRLDGVRVDIAMLRTPDGHNRLELTKFHHPDVIRTEPAVMPPNAPGLRSVMFEVDDIDDTITRLQRHGGALIGTVEDYERFYRLCYLRGPAGVIVALAQRIE